MSPPHKNTALKTILFLLVLLGIGALFLRLPSRACRKFARAVETGSYADARQIYDELSAPQKTEADKLLRRRMAELVSQYGSGKADAASVRNALNAISALWGEKITARYRREMERQKSR